jgi:hypothetical protein
MASRDDEDLNRARRKERKGDDDDDDDDDEDEEVSRPHTVRYKENFPYPRNCYVHCTNQNINELNCPPFKQEGEEDLVVGSGNRMIVIQ